jgi:preprotein translocase subunit SecB
MADDSGIASFQFVTYKIDTVNFQTAKNAGTLLTNSLSGPNQMNFEIGFRNAGKYLLNNTVHYIGGLNTQIQILDSSKTPILTGDFGISGLFRPINMDKKIEENMVRYNIPAILMPYLRAAITTIVSQAGFGMIVLPLINVYEIAKKQPVKILDYTMPFASGPQAAPKIED